MSKLIVVCGKMGTGKTTLSIELSKMLNVACLHKDSLKEPIYKFMGCKTFEDSVKSGFCSIMTLLNIAEDQIKSGVDIMIESPFNHPDNIKLFNKWIKKYKIDFYCIVCNLDEKIRLERCQNRLDKRDESHHDKKRLAILHSSIVNNFDYNNMPGRKILINTRKPVNELIKGVLKLFDK